MQDLLSFAKRTFDSRRTRSTEDFRIAKFVHEITGIQTYRPELYIVALTHASYQKVNYNNERLEFLGDSVLTNIVGHAVYELYPEDDEGSLSQLRSYLVSRHRINELGHKLGFEDMVRVGGGIDLLHTDIVGNALEAFIGALFIDKGYKRTAMFVRKNLIVSRKILDETYEQEEEDAKTAFIILMQKHKLSYEFAYTNSHTNSDGVLIHTCDLKVGEEGTVVSQGEGPSKKISHQDAARKALHRIHEDESLLEQWS